MGSAHHSLREHPIMFAFGEGVQIPLNSDKTKNKGHPLGYPLLLVAETGFEPRLALLRCPKSLVAPARR